VEKSLEQIEQNLNNAAVNIKTAWEKYLNKTTKTTLFSLSFLSGIFICYKTGLLKTALTFVQPLMNILSSFWKTQTTTVAENTIKNTVTQLPKVYDSITQQLSEHQH
jgi:hypothetical protein